MPSFESVLDWRYRHTRTIARCLALLWASTWMFFGASAGFSEGLTPAKVLLHAAVPGLIFLLTAAIAWRWEMLGAKLLLLEGLLIFAFYPVITWGAASFTSVLFVVFTMALPPLLAGILFRENWHRARVLRLLTNRLP